MVDAYSLISIEPGEVSKIFEKVKDVRGVQSAEAVAGPYDIVARIEVPSLEDLTGTVFNKIREIDGVTNTTTLIVVEPE